MLPWGTLDVTGSYSYSCKIGMRNVNGYKLESIC